MALSTLSDALKLRLNRGWNVLKDVGLGTRIQDIIVAVNTNETDATALQGRVNDSILIPVALSGTLGHDVGGGGGSIYGNAVQTDPGAATLLPVVAQWDNGESADAQATNYTTEAAESTDNDVICYPTTPEIEDSFHLGAAEKFHAVLIGISTQANLGSVTTIWEYTDNASDATSFATLTPLADETTAMQVGGTGDKLLTFVPPSDWAKVIMSGETTSPLDVAKYWIRCRMSVFGSSTTEPLVDQIWFYFGSTFTHGLEMPTAGNIDAVYFNFRTASAGNADSIFLLWNITQDTFQSYTKTKATYAQKVTGTLAVAENDLIAIMQVTEDGSTEFADGDIQLQLTPTALS